MSTDVGLGMFALQCITVQSVQIMIKQKDQAIAILFANCIPRSCIFACSCIHALRKYWVGRVIILFNYTICKLHLYEPAGPSCLGLVY